MAGYRDPRDHGWQMAKVKLTESNPYPIGSSAAREFDQGVRLHYEGKPRPNGDTSKDKAVTRTRDY